MLKTIGPDSTRFLAFTIKGHGILREIVSDIGVSPPFIPERIPEGMIIPKLKALWDTGATNSVITKSTAAALGLKPIGVAEVFHANGQSQVNVYLVNLYLPNNVLMPSIRVSECADTTNFGAIIGMDIITKGDFAITNVEGETTFTFRLPSRGTIDYEKEANAMAQMPIESSTPRLNAGPKIGRNDPCYCGSGKKYKHCHGKGS